MKEVRLTDLDELALKARDPMARSYVVEAINAYRGGAYRSSIVSTWIAVTFDIISKVRELATQGDNMAQTFVDDLNKAIDTKNIKRLQNIEDDLLKTATSDFEFLSIHEQIDIIRLREDRNLCAHPAFMSEELLFEPEPERVRMHIVHIIKHLLQHQPVQGKAAIKRIIGDITSASTFPLTIDTACAFLNSRYLDRSKKTFAQNLVNLLLKALLRGDNIALPLTCSRQMYLTLHAVSQRHPDIYEEQMRSKLLTIVDSLEEEHLPNIFRLLASDPRCWRWLDEPTKIKLKTSIQVNINRNRIIYYIFPAIAIDDLKPMIIQMFDKLPLDRQVMVIEYTPQLEFTRRAIDIYSSARSFLDAKKLGQSLILPMAMYFSVDDVRKIINIVKKNYQIYGASGSPEIIEELFKKTNQHLPHLRDSWKSLFDFICSEELSSYDGENNKEDMWSDNRWKSLVDLFEVADLT
jgi:hypothetical protein